MMLNQSFLRKGPESLDTIDIDLSLFELIPVVDVKMLISTEHERIVSPPLVCVYDRTSPYPLYCLGHKTLRRHILNNIY